jgi:hypothetical protein
MGMKTTFICDCCLLEAENNLGRARIHINGASGDKQVMPDENRDLCEICWSPLQTLMNEVHADARAKRNSSGKPDLKNGQCFRLSVGDLHREMA